MDINDLFHIPVFPEFISVAQLNIGKTLGVIMVQGSKIQILIFQKIITPAPVAAVAVTDDHIAAARGQRQSGGILESLAKAGTVTHEALP